MKTSFRVRVLSLVMMFALVSSALQAAEYYVVIGAFAHEANARRYTSTVRNFFKEVSYTFNNKTGLYYVTVMKTAHKDDARNWSLYLRHEKGFSDAWVLTESTPEAGYLAAEAKAVHAPRYETQDDRESTDNAMVGSSFMAEGQGSFGNATTSQAKKMDAMWTVSGGFGFIKDIKNIEQFKGQFSEPASRLFTFVVEDTQGKVIPAEVMLVNFEKVKKITSFLPGEKAAIKGTKANQVVTFVCDVLGYTQETRMFNMDHLSRGKDIRKTEEGIWEVRIKLKKMQLHDLAFMNKTLFYKDAAVLEPSSQSEMDELVSIMKSNPGYKVILHSHCNPSVRRDIKLPLEENNYFDLSATLEKSGSDKLLTKKRAELLRNYLISHGIDKKRVGIVAWGGMEPIVESTNEDAYINERIEVELTAL